MRMRKGHWLALGILLGAIVLTLVTTSPAQSQRIAPREEGLAPRIAKQAGLTEEQANKFLQAIGPAVRAELAAGKTVNIPNLGTLRVVRVPAHRDMIVGGREGGTPIVVAGNNTVEFLAAGDLAAAANSVNAVPADVVPPFQYITIPGQMPGMKQGRTRVPQTRVP